MGPTIAEQLKKEALADMNDAAQREFKNAVAAKIKSIMHQQSMITKAVEDLARLRGELKDMQLNTIDESVLA